METIRGKTQLDNLLEGDTGLVDGAGGRGVVGGVAMSRSCGYFRGGGGGDGGEDDATAAAAEGEEEEDDDDEEEAAVAGRRRPCWLFARKFTPRAGARIGRFSSVVMGF